MKSVAGIKRGYHALHRQWLVRRTPTPRIKVRFVVLIVFNVFSFFCTYAQTTFSKTYYNSGYNEAYSFVELSDSGFILAGFNSDTKGYALIMRTDKYGDSLWTKKYVTGWLYDIIKKNDSTFYICGQLDTSKLAIQIATIDLNGDTSDFSDYGYPPPGGAVYMETTADGGVVVMSAQSADYEFLKLDSNYNEQWHYNIFNMPNGCMKIKQTPYGEYVSVGSGFGVQPYVVSRFDSAGNQIWQYTYGNQPAWDTGTHYPFDVIVMPDSNYLVGCDGYDWQLMKINYQNGDTIWTRNFNSSSSNLYEVYDMDTAGNNRYICAMRGYVGLFDENGDSIWCKPTPIPIMWIHDIHKTTDGGYALCGSLNVFSTSSTILAFAKIDSLGNGVYLSTFDVTDNFKPVTFYPNPANTQLYISPGSMAAERNVQFTLYDLQGRVMLEQQCDGTQPVDVSAVPGGLYVATLKGGGNPDSYRELRGKVVIQR